MIYLVFTYKLRNLQSILNKRLNSINNNIGVIELVNFGEDMTLVLTT